MRNAHMDRRSLRTRQLLADALVMIMREKPYDQITVQDIIDQANIGRSTFYAHYFDKEDLLLSTFETILTALMTGMVHTSSLEPALLPSLGLFQHVYDHQRLFYALSSSGNLDRLFKRAHAFLRQHTIQRLEQLTDTRPSTVPITIVAEYIAGAFFTMVRWWLDAKMPYSPQQMDAMYQHLVLPGVAARFGEHTK